MKAKIIIRRGAKVLCSGELSAEKGTYNGFEAKEKFHADLFNIERYINTQGAYRCHIETLPPTRAGEELSK